MALDQDAPPLVVRKMPALEYVSNPVPDLRRSRSSGVLPIRFKVDSPVSGIFAGAFIVFSLCRGLLFTRTVCESVNSCKKGATIKLRR